MKRFLVFEYEHYYPAGGMDDLTESYDTLLEAINYIDTIFKDSQSGFDVFDRFSGFVIFSSTDIYKYKEYLKDTYKGSLERSFTWRTV